MVRIVLVVLICAFICVYLKDVNSQIFTIALVASGVIVMFFCARYLSEILSVFDDLINSSGIDKQLIKIILKITLIGYLVEFTSSTVEDMGLKGLADKLVFAGKLVIIITAMPIIYALFNLIKGMLI